jgi:hypothetical protein
VTPEEKQKMEMLIELLKRQGDYSPSQPSQPSNPPQQSAQGGGPSPSMAMKFLPESGGAGSGAGSSTGGSSAMAGAAPWAALAAAIIANETYQNKSGNRPDDFKEHMGDLATGKVLGRDIERYLGDGPVATHLGNMASPQGMYKNVKKSLKPWEWF